MIIFQIYQLNVERYLMNVLIQKMFYVYFVEKTVDKIIDKPTLRLKTLEINILFDYLFI